MTDTGAPPRVLIVVAAAFAAALAVAVAVLGITSAGSEDTPAEPGPLPLVSIPAPQADSAACRKLIDAGPREMQSAGETLRLRKLAKPAPPAALAWGTGNPVVLRCGLERPPELTRTSSLRQINGVRWLVVPGQGGAATWYVVDRAVYVALTVPADAGTGPLQLISDIVAKNLKQVDLRFPGS